MFEQNIYLKYVFNMSEIYNSIKKNGYTRLTFYLDLMNIARGFYNKYSIEHELETFIENKSVTTFIDELSMYLEYIYNNFSNYDLRFVIFYDVGANSAQRTNNKEYKANRKYMFEDSIYENVYTKLKEYYFEEIYKLNEYQEIYVVYLKNYETDFIPHFVISNNLINTQSKDNMNLILSTDKDLLQTLKFNNTYQLPTVYRSGKFDMGFYSKYNAINYIYSKYKGNLTAEYIPAILSIAGDKADNISGVKGLGYAKTIKLIEEERIKPDLSNIGSVDKLKDYEKLIMSNYDLISFDRHISKLPSATLTELLRLFKK